MKDDTLFLPYLITAVILAALYFTVPERKAFLDFHLMWWKDLGAIIISLFN